MIRYRRMAMYVSMALVVIWPSISLAATIFLLSGTVLSVTGEPVAEAEVFLYRTPDIRRPADFISAKTSLQGKYRLELPVGPYWAIARVRKGESYGPLALGYRHSGEPVQILIGDEHEVSLDFTVADLREQAQKKAKSDTELLAVSGRIVDAYGKGVPLAYAYARGDQHQSTFPEYLSAWSDENGHFTLLVPPGNYGLGTSRGFPPEERPVKLRHIQVDARKLPVATDLTLLIE